MRHLSHWPTTLTRTSHDDADCIIKSLVHLLCERLEAMHAGRWESRRTAEADSRQGARCDKRCGGKEGGCNPDSGSNHPNSCSGKWKSKTYPSSQLEKDRHHLIFGVEGGLRGSRCCKFCQLRANNICHSVIKTWNELPSISDGKEMICKPWIHESLYRWAPELGTRWDKDIASSDMKKNNWHWIYPCSLDASPLNESSGSQSETRNMKLTFLHRLSILHAGLQSQTFLSQLQYPHNVHVTMYRSALKRRASSRTRWWDLCSSNV